MAIVLVAGAASAADNGGRSSERNSKLAALPDNTALDLGRYECEGRVPGLNCGTIFDYSRISYDPQAHRMLVFGGGHAATGRTDVDAFDLATLTWKSLYPSMSCEDVKRADLDLRGFHRSTGHPAARHTYDQNVVVDVKGRTLLMMFSNEGFSGHCHSYKTTIEGVASLPLDGSAPKWEYSAQSRMPWGYSGAAEFDPVSGMVILVNAKSRSTLWVYDPRTHSIAAVVALGSPNESSSNLVYYPPGRQMMLIDSKTGEVREIVLDRTDWRKSTQRLLNVSGDGPGPIRNLAYDSKNRVIGGVKRGVFYAFDPETRTWTSQKMRAMSNDAAEVGNVAHHALEFDPVNNIFLFVTDRGSGRRTWAYRYRR